MAASGVRYSTKVKVDVVLAMAEMNGNASLAMELYASRHPHRPLPTRPTFTNLFRRFCTTGSVHLPRRTRKAIVDEDFEIDVVAGSRRCGHSAGRSRGGEMGGGRTGAVLEEVFPREDAEATPGPIIQVKALPRASADLPQLAAGGLGGRLQAVTPRDDNDDEQARSCAARQ
ncbi:hypothetical protein HPB51_009262 [Rhipicephalus microplus]|uniref:DUF4817 domain-containing protein n=1 Tax=Rhipicephalus microplus TaxID=6941 RepID=A0A9J6EZQ7_RHIMP|nr:hypothetical protein HPB51_009262 [Rhipicephalus microplus]